MSIKCECEWTGGILLTGEHSPLCPNRPEERKAPEERKPGLLRDMLEGLTAEAPDPVTVPEMFKQKAPEGERCAGPNVSAFDCPVHDPRRAPEGERAPEPQTVDLGDGPAHLARTRAPGMIESRVKAYGVQAGEPERASDYPDDCVIPSGRYPTLDALTQFGAAPAQPEPGSGERERDVMNPCGICGATWGQHFVGCPHYRGRYYMQPGSGVREPVDWDDIAAAVRHIRDTRSPNEVILTWVRDCLRPLALADRERREEELREIVRQMDAALDLPAVQPFTIRRWANKLRALGGSNG